MIFTIIGVVVGFGYVGAAIWSIGRPASRAARVARETAQAYKEDMRRAHWPEHVIDWYLYNESPAGDHYLSSAYPELSELILMCPRCGRIYDSGHSSFFLWHMNDVHEMTFTEIADVLDSLEKIDV